MKTIIGNRVSAQEGSSANLLRYSANNLNQYISIFSPGIIPIRGRADADAKVAVTTTIGGVSTTYFEGEDSPLTSTLSPLPCLVRRDGQDFSLDIPVDNSSGAVTAAVQVDALKHDGTLDVDLHRRLSGDYAVPAATPEAPTYDLDGNMLSHDGWTYTWNAQDRLVSATKGTTRLEFAYDYMGRRFEKKVYENNVLTKHSLFVYDGFKQIAEYDALNQNSLANTYLWQPVGLDVPLLRNGGEFYASDANKNIVALIGVTGTFTDSYIYDPFGNCAHVGTSANPFRFSSEYCDEETELVYYNYRYYAPSIGRWIKRDPIGEKREKNLMQFCLNSVVSYYDRFGLALWAIDGTGNHREIQKTNVARFVALYRDGDVYYFGGVGNAIDYPWWRIVERVAGLAFGYGAIGIKDECVKEICNYYCSNKGTPEAEKIDIVGFSRGGAIAKEIAEELEERGCCCVKKWKTIHHRNSSERINVGKYETVKVRFLGLFDPVYSMPWFWDENSITSNVQNAFTILANSEDRYFFYYADSVQRQAYNSVVVRMDGIHSDIGGFYDNGIANRALINMVSRAQGAGVKIDDVPTLMNNPSYVPSSNKENGNFSWWWTWHGTRIFDPSILEIK
ncbi:MAG: DUF2235 domain-containing protein [Victivallales bacterium]|nr:DUF2235 domain-containing protein [Victivallales bacterium]